MVPGVRVVEVEDVGELEWVGCSELGSTVSLTMTGAISISDETGG